MREPDEIEVCLTFRLNLSGCWNESTARHSIKVATFSRLAVAKRRGEREREEERGKGGNEKTREGTEQEASRKDIAPTLISMIPISDLETGPIMDRLTGLTSSQS